MSIRTSQVGRKFPYVLMPSATPLKVLRSVNISTRCPTYADAHRAAWIDMTYTDVGVMVCVTACYPHKGSGPFVVIRLSDLTKDLLSNPDASFCRIAAELEVTPQKLVEIIKSESQGLSEVKKRMAR
jgi:hypothetical protein